MYYLNKFCRVTKSSWVTNNVCSHLSQTFRMLEKQQVSEMLKFNFELSWLVAEKRFDQFWFLKKLQIKQYRHSPTYTTVRFLKTWHKSELSTGIIQLCVFTCMHVYTHIYILCLLSYIQGNNIIFFIYLSGS